MENDLPIYSTQGIEFLIDVAKKEIREKANPENKYPISDVRDLGLEGYDFYHYDASKNRNLLIEIPQFVTMDPAGMAKQYGKSLEQIRSMSDYEVMVDQDLLRKRIQSGQLPTIDIAGHTFYADARLDLLRPKDDFSTLGIRFDDLDDYYVEENKSYAFPYNPKTHAYEEREWDKVLAYPKDLLFVEIPEARILDPVGWNRRNGFKDTDDLKETGLQLEFKAAVIPWHKTGIADLIASNKLRQPTKESSNQKTQPDKKRGRKM